MKVLVITPTYNEKDSMPKTVGRLRAAVPTADVLIVDDNSPDGTGAIADEMAAADPSIHVMHRTAKNGLGAAYVAGFGWGLQRDYDVLVEMDADGSHQPEQLPLILAAIERGGDLVIGSRYVRGGSVVNWPAHRLLLSRGANIYTRLATGVPVNDATAGYRAFRREVLEAIDLPTIESRGYCFQVDMTWRAIRKGFKVMEVPIEFVEREEGVSKMSQAIVVEALVKVGRWGIEHRVNQLRHVTRRRSR